MLESNSADKLPCLLLLGTDGSLEWDLRVDNPCALRLACNFSAALLGPGFAPLVLLGIFWSGSNGFLPLFLRSCSFNSGLTTTACAFFCGTGWESRGLGQCRVSASLSSDEEDDEDDEEEEEEELEEEDEEEELLDLGFGGTSASTFLRGLPRGLFPLLLFRSSFSCSLFWNAKRSRGSRMFSSGSQLLCLEDQPLHFTRYSAVPFRSRLLRMHSAAKTCSPTALSSSMAPAGGRWI